jgi:secreted trypsin-like serine protease
MLRAITFIPAVKLRHAACAALLISGLGVASPVSAQYPGGSNWAREYVQLRVLSRNLRGMGTDSARAAGSDLRGLVRPRIVGGTAAGAGDNPFQVALLLANNNNNQAAQFCGGTLVRPNFVVTAAHCSDFVTAAQVQVLTGTRRLDGTGVRRGVTRITIHPSWNSTTFDNDVAVWQLATGADGIGLATLANDDGTVGSNLLVTGWGTLTEGGTSPVDLQRVQVPLVDRTNCNDANSYDGALTDRMLCAGLDAGGRDSCQGDSGGPLTRGANNSVLTGIVSWGIGCARPNLYGIYTRVSDATIRNFIEASIRGGTADIVWQHFGGQVHYWPIRNGVRQGGIDIGASGPVGNDWKVVGVGDVNAQ